MSYITKQQLIDKFGLEEVTQRNDPNETGVIDDVALQAHINDAVAAIDAMIGLKYALPAPDLLTRIAAELLRERYWDPAVPEKVKDDADLACKRLDNIACGKLPLQGVGNSISANSLPMSPKYKISATRPIKLASECYSQFGFEEY